MPRPKPLKYKSAPFFANATRARLFMNKSRVYSDVYRRIKKETGKEPRAWVLTEIPITREELNERVRSYETGAEAVTGRQVKFAKAINGGMIDLYTSIGRLNVNAIRGARRALKRETKAKEAKRSQLKLRSSKLKINNKIRKAAEKLIEEIKQAQYPDERTRKKHLDFVDELVGQDKLVGAFEIELKDTIEEYKAGFEAAKGLEIEFEGNLEFVRTCQQAFEKSRTETLSPENIVILYRRLIDSGTIGKILLGFKRKSQIEKQMKKPKRIHITERIKGAFAKKKERELRTVTENFIDWDRVDSKDPRAMKQAALRLFARDYEIPDFLKPYLPTEKK